MASFKIFSQDDILSYVNLRDGETKIGERVQTATRLSDLQKSNAKFVLVGIPEDIGVRANYGMAGASTAWKLVLKSLLNLQHNAFLRGEDLLVLGEVEIPETLTNNITELRNAVAEIDELVFPVIRAISAAGKIPIVVGGGHNNCYPIIKGVSLAKQRKVNVLNIDAHTDLRNTQEGRHSGNGFSTAIENGYLEQYRILGLHQNYVSEAQLNFMSTNLVKAVYFDDLLRTNKDVVGEAKTLLQSVKSPLGLEVDLDAMANALASAATPTGFSVNDLRKLVLNLENDFCYLHICESAYKMPDGRKDYAIGKKIAYLVSDFLKRKQFINLH